MHRVFSDRREENNARSFDSIDFSETIGLTTMNGMIHLKIKPNQKSGNYINGILYFKRDTKRRISCKEQQRKNKMREGCNRYLEK